MKTIFLILLTSVFATAAQITDDKLQVGKPTSSGDKILEFKGPTSKRLKRNVSTNELSYDGDSIKLGDGTNTEKKITFDKGAGSPVMRWNNSTSKLEFSNDGTIYKAFGSGSGSGSGGINLLPNPGFEDGLTGYTNTGGTVAVVDTGSNLLFDLKSVTFTATAGSQNFRSDAITIPEGLKGQNCLVKLTYKGGDSNLTLSVTDGSDVQIPNSQAPTIIASSIAKEISASFICPTSGSLKWKISSGAAAALISLDNVHLGSNIDVFQVSQAAHIGTLKYVQTASCSFSLTSAAYASYSANASCPAPSVTGLLQAPATKIPAFKMNVVAGSTYRITVKGFFYGTAAVGTSQYRFYDGTDSTEMALNAHHGAGVLDTIPSVGSAIYSPTTSGLKTIEIQALATAGSANIDLSPTTPGTDLIFEVERFPSQSQLAVNSLQTDFGPIDVPSVAVGTWLSAVTTNPTYGSTTVNKATVERIGKFAQFKWHYEQTTGGAAGTGEYLVNIPYDIDMSVYGLSQSFIDTNYVKQIEIGSFSYTHNNVNTDLLVAGKLYIYDKNRVYGIATYNGAASVTMNYWGPYGPMSENDNSLTMKFSVPILGWTDTRKAPVLVGTVASGTAGMLRVEYATVSSAGVVSNESSEWVNGNASVSDTSLYAITLNSGIFSATPTCFANTKSTGGFDSYAVVNPTAATTVDVRTGNHLPSVSQQKIAADFSLFCVGPK